MILYHGQMLSGGATGLEVNELSYEAYQALTDEQKASGAYFIPDWPDGTVSDAYATVDDVNAAIDAAITGAMEEAY